jgi:hypothetical protein
MLLLLTACADTPQAPLPLSSANANSVEITESLPPPVGAVSLRVAEDDTREAMLLNVGVIVFDPGIPPDPGTHLRLGVFPEVREAEARFYAWSLRETLAASGAWDTVRVMPEEDLATELLIRGRLKQSNGTMLAIHVTAIDSSGAVWLDQTYVDHSSASDFPVDPSAPTEPFQDLLNQVANDLLVQRDARSPAERQRLVDVARLRYAAALAPGTFGDYLAREPSGAVALLRLPAADDPMLRRVDRIRRYEHLFIDQADEQYRALHAEMLPSYGQWRQYRRDQALFQEGFETRLESRSGRVGRAGSFAALERSYNTYKWFKIQEQDIDELALGLRNEVSPTVMEVDGALFRLGGSLKAQYGEWRDILRRIFELETGTP